jgi:hypothetical protein
MLDDHLLNDQDPLPLAGLMSPILGLGDIGSPKLDEDQRDFISCVKEF